MRSSQPRFEVLRSVGPSGLEDTPRESRVAGDGNGQIGDRVIAAGSSHHDISAAAGSSRHLTGIGGDE